jgi:SAM-dependent methyltransferase
MQVRDHWEDVYSSKATDAVSWYQERADRSLRLIRDTGVEMSASIIDVGGGASTLVGDLLGESYRNLTVLDLSAAALAASRRRLGPSADRVEWIEADITTASLPPAGFDVWHDRAVFHFLTQRGDRVTYVSLLSDAIKPGGHIIIATFAEDGPMRCSGLPVMRYSPDGLHAELGSAFSLVRYEKEVHRTPSGSVQPFLYCYFRAAR